MHFENMSILAPISCIDVAEIDRSALFKRTELKAFALKTTVSSPRGSAMLSFSRCNGYLTFLFSPSRTRSRKMRSSGRVKKKRKKRDITKATTIIVLANFSRRKT